MRALVDDSLLSELKIEFLENVAFNLLYEEAKNLFGEVAARQLVYKIMKEASKSMVERFRSQGLLNVNDVTTALSLPCKAFGVAASCEREGDKLLVRVRECPLLKFDEDKSGRACITMMSLVAGMVESVTGKRVCIITPRVRFGTSSADLVIKMLKSKLLGDEECLFEVRAK